MCQHTEELGNCMKNKNAFGGTVGVGTKSLSLHHRDPGAVPDTDTFVLSVPSRKIHLPLLVGGKPVRGSCPVAALAYRLVTAPAWSGAGSGGQYMHHMADGGNSSEEVQYKRIGCSRADRQMAEI